MDKEICCDFVFGDEEPSIKEMDCSVLHSVKRVHYGYLLKKNIYIRGALWYIVKNYKILIATPSTNSITHWLLLLFFKLLPNRRIYFWTHGLYGKESKRQLFFKNLMFKNATGLFLYGNYAKELMIKEGYNPDNLFVVHNSLDYDAHLMLRNENLLSDVYRSHFRNNNPIIVSIGRLNKRKRLTMLVEAINLLNKNNLPCNIVIIGDGEDKVILEEKARLLGVEQQVWLYGACYDERRNAELLYNSDICIIPGDIGLTAIHSLMFGVPVITHNDFPHQGPEFEVVKPGQTGSFFEHDNVPSLVSCIENWLKCKKDRDEIRRACYDVIDTEWNPNYQLRVIKNVLNNNLK